jgi:hypothetical protein
VRWKIQIASKLRARKDPNLFDEFDIRLRLLKPNLAENLQIDRPDKKTIGNAVLLHFVSLVIDAVVIA